MNALTNSMACLLALGFAMFLWRGKISLLKETLLILSFLMVSELFTFFAGDLSNPGLEHYPLRMLALCLCCSTTGLPVKRRRYLVLAQVLWLWIELFGGISLSYRGFDMPWTRIIAIAGMASCSTLLTRISREMEFCLMVFWIAIWMFF